MRRLLTASLTAIVVITLTPTLVEGAPSPKDVTLARTYQMPVNALLTYTNLHKSLAVKTKVQPKLDIQIAPTIVDNWPKELLTVLNSGITYWQGQYLPKEAIPTFFFTEKDREWLKGALLSLGIDSEKTIANFDRNVGINGAATTWAGSSSENGRVFNLYLNGTEAPAWMNFPKSQVSAHEWTHNAQAKMTGDISKLPCWYKEGSAIFFGTAIAANTAGAYADLRADSIIWQSNPYFSNPPNFLIFNEKSISGGYQKYFIDRDANYPADNCGPDGTYGLGFLATEYLMQLKGKKGQVDFMTLTNSMPWKSAIAKTYGKKWPTLLKEITSYIRSSANLLKKPTDIPPAPTATNAPNSPVKNEIKPTLPPQPSSSPVPVEPDLAPAGAAAIGRSCLDEGMTAFSWKQESIRCSKIAGTLKWTLN